MRWSFLFVAQAGEVLSMNVDPADQGSSAMRRIFACKDCDCIRTAVAIGLDAAQISQMRGRFRRSSASQHDLVSPKT